MRRLASTLILVVILAGLVGYIYFVDSERTPGAAEAKPKAFDVSPENIVEVEIRNIAGETTRVERVEANWLLMAPQKADADAAAVASVTSSLASLEVQRVVDEMPADLAQYGLERPQIEVAFRARDQKEFERLQIGDKTPTGGDLYAKKPSENRVFLVSSFLDATFNKTAFDFRDKRILKFDRDAANGIEIINGPTPIQLTRSGTEWQIAKPIAARADYAAVEGVMTRLSSGQMQMISSEAGEDLRAYGLDRPAITVNVTSDSSRATLLVGKAADAGTYAKDASRPMVFTVETSLPTDLGKSLEDFRRKDMFDARSFTAKRVEVRRGAETLTFEKTTTDGKDAWRNAAGTNVDTTMVEDLLTKLSNLRAQSFDASKHPSLTAPVLTAIVQFDDKTETVTFGRSGADVFGSRSDEPGTARLEAATFDEALKAIDALK
jgi:hypothetical protein